MTSASDGDRDCAVVVLKARRSALLAGRVLELREIRRGSIMWARVYMNPDKCAGGLGRALVIAIRNSRWLGGDQLWLDQR